MPGSLTAPMLNAKPPPRKIYRIPPGKRLYAVGDIHGRIDLLRRLLDMIGRDAATIPDKEKELVFLGDYVDRGLKSNEVLSLLHFGLPKIFNPIFLRGNHEDAMLRFIDGDLGVAANWFHFGGRETIASYGMPLPPRNPSPEQAAAIHAALLAAMPAEDLAFLRATRLYHQCGDYGFAHAGVRPGVPLQQQKAADLMFIRGEFLNSDADFGALVVHGHTIAPEPEVRHNRIGIDTGAYATGKLTCLVLEGSKRKFVQT